MSSTSHRSNGNGLTYDPQAAARHLAAADRRLARVIQRVGPIRLQIQPTQSMFAVLLKAIVHQQLSGKAAATIWGRLCEAFPSRRPTARVLVELRADDIRRAGLSAAKVLAAQDLANKTLSGLVPTPAQLRRLSSDEIVSTLVQVRGIGAWTVEMLLIFRLGRPDVLPVTDLGIRKGVAALRKKTELPAPKEVSRLGEAWRPYRSVASWYLWRSLDPRPGT